MYEVLEQAKTNLVRKVRALGAFEDIGLLPRKGREGTSWEEDNVLYLDKGLGYIGVCICQNI